MRLKRPAARCNMALVSLESGGGGQLLNQKITSLQIG